MDLATYPTNVAKTYNDIVRSEEPAFRSSIPVEAAGVIGPQHTSTTELHGIPVGLPDGFVDTYRPGYLGISRENLPSICEHCSKPLNPGDYLVQNNDDGRITRCTHYPQEQDLRAHR